MSCHYHQAYLILFRPEKRVSLNRGAKMPAWYDILGLHEEAAQDQSGILESAKAILEIVAEEERKGIPRNKIVIGGFSQGGVIALTTGLLNHLLETSSSAEKEKQQFAGILALSTYLPIKDHFLQHKSQISSSTPIYMAHGTADQVISYRWAELSRKFMINDLNCEKVKFETISDMGHSVNDDEINSIAKFLSKVLKY